MGKKEEIVWQYLLKNKLATPTEVAEATGVSYGYANQLMKRIGTPRDLWKKEATDFDRAIANAPIRDTVNVWTDRAWQFAVVIGIAVVVGAWLYIGL